MVRKARYQEREIEAIRKIKSISLKCPRATQEMASVPRRFLQDRRRLDCLRLKQYNDEEMTKSGRHQMKERFRLLGKCLERVASNGALRTLVENAVAAVYKT